MFQSLEGRDEKSAPPWNSVTSRFLTVWNLQIRDSVWGIDAASPCQSQRPLLDGVVAGQPLPEQESFRVFTIGWYAVALKLAS